MPILRWLLCGMLLAGCSGASMSTGTPSVSPAALASASPTAKPQLTNRQLGNMYLNAVRPFNEFTCRFFKRHGTATDMATWMTFAVTYGGQIRTFADRLQSIDWNRKTRGEARRLTGALATQETGYRYAASQEDRDRFWDALNDTDRLDAGVTQAADVLRAALGIKGVRSCI